MNSAEKIYQFRKCSQVKRCHTMMTDDKYTVGQHSFDALVLLLELNPDASKELMKAVMYHDFAEQWCGDLPHSFKQVNPEIMVRFRDEELKWDEQHNIDIQLSWEDNEWLKMVDILECWLWAMDEYLSGNKQIWQTILNCHKVFIQHTEWPTRVKRFIVDSEKRFKGVLQAEADYVNTF